MGAGQSSQSGNEEKVFHNDTSIQFSPDVVNQLADSAASGVPPLRQSTLDAHIKSRIQAEVSRLQQQEEDVKREIEHALEKENLDKELSMANDEDGVPRSSVTLMGDVEEIRQRVQRFHSRRELDEFPNVKESKNELTTCYRENPTTPLNCWKQVFEFKTSVAAVEQKYVESLS